MATFKVGEIAILCNLEVNLEWAGREVTVTKDLTLGRLWIGDTLIGPVLAYRVIADWFPPPLRGIHYAYQPYQLRKRPPPSDAQWNKLLERLNNLAPLNEKVV